MLKTARFIYFNLTILFTSILMLPLCLFRPRNFKNTGSYLTLFNFLSRPLGLTGEVQNENKIQAAHPSILIGNHQDNLDIWVASIAFKHRIVSLGKQELLYIPFFGIIFWLTGNIFVNRSNKKSARKSLEKVKNILFSQKISCIIFPEGHRNPADELLPFKKGAFYTAINSGLPISMFAVSRYVNKVDFNKLHAGHIKVSFIDPIPTEGLTEADIPDLMQRCRSILTSEIDRLTNQ